MAGIAQLRMAELYRPEGGSPPPPIGSTASLQPYQCREMEAAVRAAMRRGRVSMADGREELRLLGLCREALGADGGVRSVPVEISKDQFPVRPVGSGERKKKSREKAARKAGRKPKKRRKR